MIERSHPEGTCQQCGGPNCSWSVDSDRFNAAMAAIGRDRGAIVCPTCFMDAHEKATSLTTSWDLVPGTPFRPVERQRVTCSGCDPHVPDTILAVIVAGYRCLIDTTRFPGAALWDVALHAAEQIGGTRPETDWEYRDTHGNLHDWKEHVRDYTHSHLHVNQRAGVGG